MSLCVYVERDFDHKLFNGPKTHLLSPFGLMSRHPLAGKPAPKDLLIDVGRLEAAFYEAKPDTGDPNQLVSFGTSGHRGTSLNATFAESHLLAITQAICE
jgi:phosphoglucomutase